MTKFILTAFMLLATSILLSAQVGVTEVKVHLKGGETVDVLVFIDQNRPWDYQAGLMGIPPELRDAKKIKKRDYIKLKAKDIKAYEYNGRYFKSMKVVIGARENGGSNLSMLPGYSLLERVQEGTITVYTGYPTPQDDLKGEERSRIYAEHRDNPNYFLEKASMKKAKNMDLVNIEKIIKDCPEVHTKWKEGAYGNFAMEEGKKMKNFLKKAANGGAEGNGKKLKMIAEYNTVMSAEASN